MLKDIVHTLQDQSYAIVLVTSTIENHAHYGLKGDNMILLAIERKGKHIILQIPRLDIILGEIPYHCKNCKDRFFLFHRCKA